MKKIIGVLGVVAIAVALYFNVNSVNNNTDLASLIAMNTASAESGTATVPCVDVPQSGTLDDARKCDGCTWDTFDRNDNGTCTFDY